MQTTENLPKSYLPVPLANSLPKTTEITFSVNQNVQAPLTYSIGNIRVTTAQVVDVLTAWGEYHAIQLARILDTLKKLDETAIYPIISLIEPFLEATEDFDIPFPPKSSHSVTIQVTNTGNGTLTNFLNE